MAEEDKKYMALEWDEDRYEHLRDRYWKLSSLLCYILVGRNYSDKNDIDAIVRFINVPTFDRQDIKLAIEQSRKLLALNPFPEAWIAQVTGGITVL